MILLCLLLTVALAAPLEADQAVAAALERSVRLAEAEAASARAEGALRAARGLRHDPTLGAELAVVGEAWGLSVEQPLSLSGEGLAQQAAARHALTAAEARRERVALEVAAETRMAWVAAVVERQRVELAARALAVARRILAAAREREAVGEVSLLDLRLARLQVEQVRTTWIAATVAEGRATATLAVAVGRSVEALELPADPLAGAPRPEAGGGSRSDVEAASAELDAARAALSRERAAALPPVTVGAFVEQEEGELRAGPSLSLTLPLWSRNVDGRTAARAELSTAEARQQEAERQARAELHTTGQVSAALEAAVADQGADLPAEAAAALDSVALGYDRGELDLLSTALLQAEILEGQAAWLDGRRLVAEARLEQLLAVEDRRLLGP